MHKFTNMPKNRHNYKQRRPSIWRAQSTLINSHSTRHYSYHGRCSRGILATDASSSIPALQNTHTHTGTHKNKQIQQTCAFLSSILLEFPLPVIKWTHLPCLQPPGDAVEVEGVIAHTPRNGALLTRR